MEPVIGQQETAAIAGWADPQMLLQVASIGIVATLGILAAATVWRKGGTWATMALSAYQSRRPLSTDELKRKKKRALARNKEIARIVRMAIPIGLILLNIRIGWNNMIGAAASMDVPAGARPALVGFFVGTALWAGWERYRRSRGDRTASQFTVLMWTVTAGESFVHLLNAFANSDVHGVGNTIALAAFPWAALATFELALATNRKEAREEKDADGAREIPTSYRWRSPLLYLKLKHTKDNYPEWTFREIIVHVRANQAADAGRRLNAILNHHSGFLRFLLGERRAQHRFRKSLIGLAPYGRPNASNPRVVLANLLNLNETAQAVALASGDREKVLTALGLSADEAHAELHSSSSAADVTAEATVSTSQQEGSPRVDWDAELSELLEVDSGHPPEIEQGNAPMDSAAGPSELDTGHTEPSNTDVSTGKQGVQSAGQPKTRKPKKKKASTGKLSREEQMEMVLNLVLEARREGRPDPSGRTIAKQISASPATGIERLKEAQEQADEQGVTPAR